MISISTKFLILLSIIIITISCKNIKGQSGEKINNYILKGTEIREVKSKITHGDYELYIDLPYSYNKDKNKKYPVVYFCDGFYDFALFYSLYGQQIYDKTINECFLVGFSYKGKNLDYDELRKYDYSPVEVKERGHTGGAPDFLKVIEYDFIPFIQKNYRVDTSFRALGGSSFGGLFTLYAMFTKPGLFNAYIAISPGVIYGKDWIFNYVKEFSNQHNTLPVSLYMTGGEKELPENPDFIKGILRFNELLEEMNFGKFRYSFRILDDTYHSGSKPEGYYRGLKFIFAPILHKQ